MEADKSILDIYQNYLINLSNFIKDNNIIKL